MTMQVQVRDNEDSNEWRPAEWLHPQSVDSTNKQYFGWGKYRLAPKEEA